ncbi:SusE domain-containing protein [Pararcticibacter amylolyticus]|uniref:SusE outer membrane protein domain-containing protein n=1 Tax=Pararcticibacter amylolyticus TaxID=2173175 RepID=A0A2U2PI45_9SPHI|nr:SusE domain-containing protein [Pararcticibacter amylolyticus]PWG80932.1 hypothetical protein DDR33_08280 [Pararcticibacter amylolyticus]
MKKIKFLYKIFPLLFSVVLLTACEQDVMDIKKVQERLELKASAESITLSEEHLTDDIVTFTWTEARQVSDDHLVSYTTKLDIVGNNFGSSTAIMNYEDEGVLSRSFTSEQLQNWANEKWGVPVNKPFTLEFRVVAQWEGGATFEAPEVRTVRVNVQPIKTVVFDADKVFLDGTAVPGMSPVEMSKTVENPNQYASLVNLEAGDLQIPVEFQGATNYIFAADGNQQLQDGATGIKMRETAFAWKIETPGQYRIVVNMQKATVAIYSPETDLKPAVVEWPLSGVTQTTTVNNLWEYGEPTGWAWRTGNWKQSLADPQVFIYSGPALSGRTKFGVQPNNQTYVYTGNNTATNTPVTLGTVYNLFSGYTTNERNAYFSIPAGTNFIILDIRNMTMVASKK